MSKCIYDLSEDCNNTDCLTCILNKIRAEIETLSNTNPSYWYTGDLVDRDDVLEIIDKYKAEREEE